MNLRNWSLRLGSFSRYNFLLYVHYSLALIVFFKLSIPLLTLCYLFFAYLLIGFGGYLFNDWFDRNTDKKAGKLNVTEALSIYQFTLLLLVFWGSGFFLILAINLYAACFILIQFLLLVVYSHPLFRLKESGWLGLITDAFYAHLLPAWLLLFVLSDFGKIPLIIWIGFLFFNFFLGVRDIIIHQLEDVNSDRLMGVKTIAVVDEAKVRSVKKSIVLILNTSLLILLICALFLHFSFALLSVVILISVIYFKNIYKNYLIERSYVFLSSWLLIGQLIITKDYLFLLFVFHPYFIEITIQSLKTFYFDFFKLYVNVGLYYLFLFFGRDLKKKPLYEKRK
jgi:4-hydroxybenzoate polyprenyltransferase